MDKKPKTELNDETSASVENINTPKKRSNLKGRWRPANQRGRGNVAESADENKPGIIKSDSDTIETEENGFEDKGVKFSSPERKKRPYSEGFSLSRDDKKSSNDHCGCKNGRNFSPHTHPHKHDGKTCCTCCGIKGFFKKIVSFFTGKKSECCSVSENDREKKDFDRSRRSNSRFQHKRPGSFRPRHSGRKRPE